MATSNEVAIPFLSQGKKERSNYFVKTLGYLSMQEEVLSSIYA